MPRAGTFMYPVNVADGFADDCDELIARCSKKEPLTYHHFCKIWKEMRFPTIYKGRVLSAEIGELSEEVLQIAKHYLTMDTSNFEESVAGLFLVYALYSQQPYAGFASLRLTPEDMAAVNFIQTVARRERRFDVLYILGAVLVKAAQYHAVSRERGMDGTLRKYLDGCTGYDRNGVRPKGVFLRQNEEMDLLREISSLGEKYKAAKTDVADCEGVGAEYKCMDYVDFGVINEFSTSLKRLINGLLDDDDEGNSASQKLEASPTPQEIKQRAMKSAIVSVRHLTSVEQRPAKVNNAPICDIKSKPGKVKSGSWTKVVSSRSPRKLNLLGEISPQPSTSKESLNRDSLENSSPSTPNESSVKTPEASSRGRTYSRGRPRGPTTSKSSTNYRSKKLSLIELEDSDEPLLSSSSSSSVSPVSTKVRRVQNKNKLSDESNKSDLISSDVVEEPTSKIDLLSKEGEVATEAPTTKVSKKRNKSSRLAIAEGDSLLNIINENSPTRIAREINPSSDNSASRISTPTGVESNSEVTKRNLRQNKSPKDVSSPSKTSEVSESSPNVSTLTDNQSPKIGQEKTAKASPNTKNSLKTTPNNKSLKVSPENIIDTDDPNKVKKASGNSKLFPKRSKRRRKISTSSSESSDESNNSYINAVMESDSDLDVSDEKLTDDEVIEKNTAEEANTRKRNDSKTVKANNNKDKNSNAKSALKEELLKMVSADEERELNIEIDSLPIIIRNEKGGSMIEIPMPNVLDINKPQNAPETDVRVLRSRLRSSKDVSLNKINAIEESLRVGQCSEMYHSMARLLRVSKPQNKSVANTVIPKAQNRLSKVATDVPKPQTRLSAVTTVDPKPQTRLSAVTTADQKPQNRLSMVTRATAMATQSDTSESSAIPKLKRPDRREQKKTLLKSKFSRLGILPIANFEDKKKTKKVRQFS